ncbi:serine hydrolase [Roseomonas sp. 18066]|uniref:serine hydrolase n=1 Tax=Roseomonas sp. 18066 TaxID=2681412 RepID=UPI00135B0D63|nr:serine hydrolase [Roseomonas sp. 18066]
MYASIGRRGVARLLAASAALGTTSGEAAAPDPKVLDLPRLSREHAGDDRLGWAISGLHRGQLPLAGFGQAHLEHPSPITSDSLFRAASVSKQFSGFAISATARMNARSGG